ncbi:hypothetical protein NDU88_006800 [Pleurodeles waltl]|uniref:Uncharacterized protein n=1 Tax=Pleurodeles waltl TaxID=8319 RepID=A0AAV7WGP3_PLEWA|nr:hypothetical protein NDU88_006800 [Pleurodeles waltl]
MLGHTSHVGFELEMAFARITLHPLPLGARREVPPTLPAHGPPHHRAHCPMLHQPMQPCHCSSGLRAAEEPGRQKQ